MSTDATRLWDTFDRERQRLNFTVEWGTLPTGPDGLRQGVCDFRRRVIIIDQTANIQEAAFTLGHELGHVNTHEQFRGNHLNLRFVAQEELRMPLNKAAFELRLTQEEAAWDWSAPFVPTILREPWCAFKKQCLETYRVMPTWCSCGEAICTAHNKCHFCDGGLPRVTETLLMRVLAMNMLLGGKLPWQPES